MTTALIPWRDGTLGQVQVFRNGDTVTVRGAVSHQTPGGVVQGVTEWQMPTAAFEHLRKQAIAKIGTLAYTRIIGRIGVDDNVMRAPPLPNFRPLAIAAGSSPRPFLPPRR